MSNTTYTAQQLIHALQDEVTMLEKTRIDHEDEIHRLTGLLVKVWRQNQWQEQLTIEALNQTPDEELSEKARWEWGQLMLVIAKEIGVLHKLNQLENSDD